MMNYYGSFEDNDMFAQVKKLHHNIFARNMFFSFMFTEAKYSFQFHHRVGL